MDNIISLIGIFAFIAIAWLFSANKKNFNWHAVGWGIALQFIIAIFLFRVPAGTRLFLFLNDAVIKLLDSAAAGSSFVFGALAIPPGQQGSLGFMLAFQAFPTIIFFSALIGILYFIGIMPRIVNIFARVFTKLMRISGAEALVASSNIFVGVESALIVKPYLNKMTRSELCVVLTAGMATVASNILVLYVFSLKPYFPTIAGHLISASLLAAPASIVMAKIIIPEDGAPETLGMRIKPYYEKESTIFEAIINNANAGLKMIVGIVALLIAVLGLVALTDLLLHFIGNRANILLGWNMDWSLKALCGYVFYPLTLLLGVNMADAGAISRIIGERLVVTEVVAYQDLAKLLAHNGLTQMRSAVIATYALCGFAHLASMAIFVGGTAALAPERTSDLARIAWRSLLAATLACLMTGCIVGVFYTGKAVLF
jgi:CNT family concentrative nucleoside transporter